MIVMTLKDLVHADKISTPTDRKLLDLSLVFDMVCLVALTVLLILKKLLSAPVLPLFAGLAMIAGFMFVFSLFYTVAILLRKRSVKVLLSLLALLVSAVLTVLVIAV